MVTNKQIATVLMLAKGHLATGLSNDEHKCIFICNAVSRVGKYNTHCAAIADHVINNIITARIGQGTLGGWLMSQGVKKAELTYAKMQAHRHAWIDLLIEEFSAK